MSDAHLPHWHKGRARTTIARSLEKTIMYRLISLASTGLIAWAIFGTWELAGTFALLDAGANTLLYFAHERLWAHLDLRSKDETQELSR